MKLSDLRTFSNYYVQCHNNPDADAIASGFALYTYFQSMHKHVRLIYSGQTQIQKSNLVLMVAKLSIPIEYIAPEDTSLLESPENTLLITVDCQYGAGNVTKFNFANVAIIDHHQIEMENIPLSEIRSNYGSCSTVVWSMMKEEGFDFTDCNQLGTALYYGLFSDTNQFSEIHNPVDLDMTDDIPCQHNLISLFKNSNLSLSELEIAGIALIRHIVNTEHKYAIIKAKPCDPNILGFISDLVLQVDSIHTCVVYSELTDGFKFSIRSCTPEVKASELAAFLSRGVGSGGGHLEKAGGFISRKKYLEQYPTLHSEGFISDRLNDYFDHTTIIYARNYEIDLHNMLKYMKRPIPLGFVDITGVVPEGTPLTIRTLEGDIDITASADIYIMIGIQGEVYPIKKEKFLRTYRVLEAPYQAETEYIPTVRNRQDGSVQQIDQYAKACVATGITQIYARELTEMVNIFSTWDEAKYMHGEPGDYLAARCDDLHDIYIVEKNIFAKTYERID